MNRKLDCNILAGRIVLLTGAGGGIGFEAAKAFSEMGAKILIVEVNREKGTQAAEYINEIHFNSAEFFHADLSDESATKQLCEDILTKYGCPDIIFNNATVAIIGSIGTINIMDWDQSYAINLKAPILLTTLFLHQMKNRDSGCIVFVSSSGAAPYLGAYEIFKTAQVEFSNTLAMELEGTNVSAYTISPGLVKTNTAEKSIEIVASNMGMTVDEFYQMNASHILDVTDAGVGFAVSVLKAKEYHGQEISSIQALNDFDVQVKEPVIMEEKCSISPLAIELISKIISTFQEQYEGWRNMNIFERQWVLRDFKKHMGISADTLQNEFLKFRNEINSEAGIQSISRNIFEKLQYYWEHQLKLLQGYEKNSERLAENSKTISEWITDIKTLLTMFGY
ncbi:SDR family NAD(P)-dependent oxidoreductase [Clostridium sp. UBA1056]|uniref:SDR family NAD(P)-dependent oxidoreductase n=1 Tax=unclassified Clostridium TaxID=2614128 RepID=UPI003217ED9C